MSLRRARYPLILIALILLVGILTLPVMAEKGYREIKGPEKVHPDKLDWLIEFTMPISPDSLSENIYIQKEADQTIHKTKLELKSDQKVVRVISSEPYAHNSTYHLYLDEGLRSNDNPNIALSQKTRMTFTTLTAEEILPTISLNVADNDTIKGPSETYTFKLEGSLDKIALIKINGAEVKVNKLKFSQDINLKVGKNPIEIVAKDTKDRLTKKTINLNYEISKDGLPGGGGGGDNPNHLDAEIVRDLQKVNSSLNTVINDLNSPATKNIAQNIQINIDKKIADHNYDHSGAANEAYNQYKNLTLEQKEELEDAILEHIPLSELVVLGEYFGFL